MEWWGFVFQGLWRGRVSPIVLESQLGQRVKGHCARLRPEETYCKLAVFLEIESQTCLRVFGLRVVCVGKSYEIMCCNKQRNGGSWR